MRSVLVCLFIPLIGCAQQSASLHEEIDRLYMNSVPTIPKEQAEKNRAAIFLDTREREEFDISHIPGAKSVGYDDFKLGSVRNLSTDDTLIVYCSVGYRSERIGEKLQEAGFKHVYNLYGGIFNWKNLDGLLVDVNGDTTERVHTYNKRWSRFLEKGEKVW